MPKERIAVKTKNIKKDPNLNYRAEYQVEQKKARAQTKSVINDPKYNPAGKGKFYTLYAPLEKSSTFSTYADRDPSASARGANARANKARGTQASSKRVPVK